MQISFPLPIFTEVKLIRNMKKYINRDMLIGFGGGETKKGLQYPLRVGRKQRRAVLDANGVEVVVFNKGQEELAQLTCDLLNNNHKDGLPWLLNKLEQYSDRYMEAESFIMSLGEMNFLQRAFSFSKIVKFISSRK